jgi:hypothetical protein
MCTSATPEAKKEWRKESCKIDDGNGGKKEWRKMILLSVV